MQECPECKKRVDEKDFIKGICYKCLYRIKLSEKDIKKCKWCGNKAITKGRWAYCSLNCANLSAAEKKKKYWTNHITCEKKNWHTHGWIF